MLDFLGIGARKAGTTWLFKMLALHPKIRFPAGKEVHFGNEHKARGTPWYLSLFEAPTDDAKRGEIAPAYAVLPETIIADIAALIPDVRILYILRNPIARAWSSALMAMTNAKKPFHETSDAWFIGRFRGTGSIERGDYEACLRRWRSVFRPDQILVSRYEKIRDDPLGLLEQCVVHLGVDNAFYATVPHETLSRKVHSGPGHPLQPSLFPVLQEIYRPKI